MGLRARGLLGCSLGSENGGSPLPTLCLTKASGHHLLNFFFFLFLHFFLSLSFCSRSPSPPPSPPLTSPPLPSCFLSFSVFGRCHLCTPPLSCFSQWAPSLCSPSALQNSGISQRTAGLGWMAWCWWPPPREYPLITWLWRPGGLIFPYPTGLWQLERVPGRPPLPGHGTDSWLKHIPTFLRKRSICCWSRSFGLSDRLLVLNQSGSVQWGPQWMEASGCHLRAVPLPCSSTLESWRKELTPLFRALIFAAAAREYLYTDWLWWH